MDGGEQGSSVGRVIFWAGLYLQLCSLRTAKWCEGRRDRRSRRERCLTQETALVLLTAIGDCCGGWSRCFLGQCPKLLGDIRDSILHGDCVALVRACTS